MKLLQFKINYWTVEITCRTAVLITYISHQKNGGFHGFIQGVTEGIMEKVVHYVLYMHIVKKVYALALKAVSKLNTGLLVMFPAF